MNRNNYRMEYEHIDRYGPFFVVATRTRYFARHIKRALQ